MVCEQCQENLSAFLDGELSAGAIAESFSHLSSCHTCTSFVSSALGVRSLLARESAPSVPVSLDRRMRATPHLGAGSLLQRASTVWQTRIALPLPAAIAIGILALIMFAAGATTWMGLGPQSETKEPVIVYIRELPAIDVYGSAERPDSHTENGEHNL